MGKFNDLTGQTFTHLKVLKRAPNRGRITMWWCECICGKQKSIAASDLRSKKTKGCGSYCSYEPRKRIENKQYGKLTVIKLMVGLRSTGIDSRPLWQVKCECGNIFETTLHALNPGKDRKGLRQCGECNKAFVENRLVGEQFYFLKVLKFAYQDKWGGYIWECLCRCGKTVLVSTSSLERSSTKSCGCYTKERLRTHGKSKTSLYRVWNHARRRCNMPNDKSYSRYGGRGIKMCSEWLDNFEVFEAWALKNGYIAGLQLQLDRINVDDDYSPANCQFVSKNCNSAFAWLDKMDEEELKKAEDRIKQRRTRLSNSKQYF